MAIPGARYVGRWLSWCLSALMVAALITGMLLLQGIGELPEQKVTVRKVNVALPQPPAPPPPIQKQQLKTRSHTPSISVAGLGGGPEMHYSDKPEIGMPSFNRVQMPKFKMAAMDLVRTLSVDFPVLKVKALDKVPHAVSHGRISYPRVLARRGIVNVVTTVELIIDTRGKAYIKKIVDPVYPEMIKPIRQWVNSVRFTKPTKNGQPVQAVYIYSLAFHYRR